MHSPFGSPAAIRIEIVSFRNYEEGWVLIGEELSIGTKNDLGFPFKGLENGNVGFRRITIVNVGKGGVGNHLVLFTFRCVNLRFFGLGV